MHHCCCCCCYSNFDSNIQLFRFNYLGLANLFPGTANQNRATANNEQEQINEIYQKHINECIASQYGKIEDWNDIRQKEGRIVSERFKTRSIHQATDNRS